MTVLAVASAGAQIHGQRQQAKAQEKVQKNASIAERQRYLSQVSSMRMQQAQEQVGMAQRIQASTKKAREARATARVSAGEAGVAGLSVDALINSLTQQEAQYSFSETQNQQMTNVNRELQLRDAGIGFTNNMLRINKPIAQPDYLGAVLSGAQTGMSMASAGKDFGMKTPFTK
jgi:precorrin-3B methylase